MRKLALVLAAALAAGCEAKKEDPKPAPPPKAAEGSQVMPKPVKEEPKEPAKPPAETPKPVRKVVDASKKGFLTTFRCQCTGKEWTQPAEEEKLCIDYCEGKMPECGELVKTEPAAK